MRGEAAMWLCLVLTFLGMLFPHVFAADFLDDASVVRWISVPVFLACAVILGDKYVF